MLDDIKRVVAFARDSESRFIEMLSNQSQKEIEKSVRKAKTEYAKAENRIKQLDDIIHQIYEDKVAGQLSAERFAKMLEKYEREQSELTVKIGELNELIEQAETQTQSTDKFLRIVKAHTEIEELTAEVVNEFIEKIVVGETVITQPRKYSHWKSERQQNIRIIYNYIGEMPPYPAISIAVPQHSNAQIPHPVHLS